MSAVFTRTRAKQRESRQSFAESALFNYHQGFVDYWTTEATLKRLGYTPVQARRMLLRTAMLLRVAELRSRPELALRSFPASRVAS
jgi:hypothetical protein